jgi:gluconolactonase
VAAGTKVEIVKTGLRGTEGPVAMPDGSILICETAANRIARLDTQGNVSTFVEPSHDSVGLGLDRQGRLIAAQTAQGHAGIGVLHPKGAATMLTDSLVGKPYSRPNDVVIDAKGGVYFTDPGINPLAAGAPPAGPERDAAIAAYGVFYIPPGGKAARVVQGSGRANPIWRPNGIQLSPDEKILYVNDSYGEYILAFDVQGDGTLRNRRNFAKYPKVDQLAGGLVGSQSDGLAIDATGRLYSAASGGIQVYSPTGQFLGTIPMPTRPQNLAFGDADRKSLYGVGMGNAFRIKMLVRGPESRAK